MKVKRAGISILGITITIIVMIGAIFPSKMGRVYAQGLSTETSTPDFFFTETPIPPIIETETIPPILPVETNTETPTPSPEIPILTQTPEPTYTETWLPTETLEIPSGDFHWKVSIEVPIQSAELRSFGGVGGAETHLENTLQNEITDEGVAFDVNTTRITNTSATYIVELEGTGGIDQFVQTVYSDLNEQLNLLNGPIQLRITGYVQTGQIIPVILESNITTGYLWELVSYDATMLEKQGKPLFEQKMSGIGAPSKEMITLRAIADGMTTITINYRQPFDRGERQTRFIDLTDGKMPDVIDLSNPFQVNSSLPPAPFTGDAAPELQTIDPVVSLPATFDWKAEGKVTAVRDQGSCGSCWAFGTVGAMESAILIQSGQAVDLSEQFLVSCNASGWSCNGGWWAHNYHMNTLANLQSVAGAVLEADMPYTATNGTCRTITNHPYKLTNWYSIAGYSIPTVDQIKNAISTYGPVAAAICVGPGFSGYRSGVFATNESSSCTSTVNHAIVLTGWDDTTQSWVLRNSWGSNWGEAGYMRIKWGTSNVGYAANYVVYTAGATPTPGGPTVTNTPVPQAPANDDIIVPAEMSLANDVFTANQNITAATTASDDPVFACVAGKGYKSVWYRYTATQTGSININTTGSEYDTILGVWQGSRGALTSIACNDDVASGQTQSQVNLNVSNGQVFYIEAAGYNSYASGLLNITISFTPAATSTFTPTATFTPTSTKTNTPTRTSTPTITPRPPVGYGTYDERSAEIVFTGSWVAQSISGNYQKTEKYSKVVGSNASFTFTGENVSVIYRGYPSAFGLLEVKIDGTFYANINQSTTVPSLQNRWNSGNLGSGTHTIILTHLTGTYVTLDGIIVSGPPTATPTASNTFTPTNTRTSTPTVTSRPPVSYGTYDERSAEIVYTGSWVAQSINGNYANTEKYSSVIGSSARFTFTGENVSIIYRGYPSAFGLMEVKLDGTFYANINQSTTVPSLQNRWNSGNLGAGTHTLTLTHVTGTYVTLDGIVVSAPLTATPTARPTAIGCTLFPSDNIWNTRIDNLPTAVSSNAYISSIGSATTFHPDFGSGTWEGAPIGIPYNVVSSSVTPSIVNFDYADESDSGPYPIPANPLIEGGSSSTGDRHILILKTDTCMLYELYSAYPQGSNTWQAGSGAIYDLRSNLLRPAGWTSADAAGLPILPGLIRYDEILSGEITHTIRFTAALTRNQYVWPARHQAGSTSSSSVPPMGQVFRLKANFDISDYPPEIQIIFTAFKRYGIILADNGSNWYVSGTPDERWNNEMLLDAFNTLHGSNFEAVDTSSLVVSADSGQVQ